MNNAVNAAQTMAINRKHFQIQFERAAIGGQEARLWSKTQPQRVGMPKPLST